MSDHSDYFTVFLMAYIVLSFEVFGRVILPRLRSGRFKDFWDREFFEEISPYTLPPALTFSVTQIIIILLAELTISYLGPGTSEDIFRFYFVMLLALVPTVILIYSVVHLCYKISGSLILMHPVVILLNKTSDLFARANPGSAWYKGGCMISPILNGWFIIIVGLGQCERERWDRISSRSYTIEIGERSELEGATR